MLKLLRIGLLPAFSCFFFLANAQNLSLVWDRQPTGTAGFQVHDAKLLRKKGYAQMAVAGEYMRGGAPFSALYIIDCTDGAITDSLLLPGGGLLALAESENSALYAGGYHSGIKGKKGGRIVRYNYRTKGVELDTFLPEIATVNKMVWLDRSGLAIGTFKEDQGSVPTFLLGKAGRAVSAQRDAIGNGFFKTVSAVLPAPDGKVWLAGISAETDINKANQAVTLKVDENGHFTTTPTVLGEAKRYEEVTAAALNEQGQLLMAGAAQIDSEDDDPWILKPSVYQPERNENATNFPWETIGDDRITAMTFTTCHDFLLLRQMKEGRGATNSLHRCNGQVITPNAEMLLPGKQVFRPAAFLRDDIREEVYYLIGTVADADGKNARLRLLCLKENCAKGGGKGATTLSDSGAKSTKLPSIAGGKGGSLPAGNAAAGPVLQIENMELFQPDRPKPEAVVGGGSEVLLRFSIVLKGGEDMETAGKMTVSNTQLVRGLSIDQEDMEQAFPALRSTRKTHVMRIRLTTEQGVASGTSSFTITLKMGTQELLVTSSLTIRTGEGEGGTTIVSWVDKGERSTEQERTTRRVIVHTPNANIQPSNLVVRESMGREKQNKAQPKLIDSQHSNGIYTYTFDIEMALDTGVNRLFVQVNDGEKSVQTEVWEVERSTTKPNLYVLSVGIPYGNLSYTTHDARDFVETARKMAGGTFFGEVKFSFVANTSEGTTAQAIRDALTALTNQQGIRATDYIMVLISSHGDILRTNQQERFFIQPSDYHPDGVTARGTETGKEIPTDNSFKITRPVYYYDIIEVLKNVECRRFLFIDACHSGLGKGADRDALIQEANSAAPGLVCFVSSSAQQLSYEYPNGKNGIFTEALLEAMQGKPVRSFREPTAKLDPDPDRNGLITIAELQRFLEQRVPDLLLDSPHAQNRQTPVLLNRKAENNQQKELPDSQPVFEVRP